MLRLFMRFPEGRQKVLTLSYDDGTVHDIRLIEIMNRYGIKGTFNINSMNLYPEELDAQRVPGFKYRSLLTPEQMLELYPNSGHEVALHSATHPFLNLLPSPSVAKEIVDDRTRLEAHFGTIIRGMAYPFGPTNDETVQVLKDCGVAYARTVTSTGNFLLPTDWLRLPATCHHNEPQLMELLDTFLNTIGRRSQMPWMFYLWGHSYEFDENNNWEVIENFCEKAGNHPDVWYATNIEIYDYIQAYHRLQFDIALTKVYNPSVIPVWLATESWPSNRTETYCIMPGETVDLKQ